MDTFIGFLQVRRAISALVFILLLTLIAVLFPFVSIGVTLRPVLAPRGVGIAEICALSVACFLPILTRPKFNALELQAFPLQRIMQVLFTGMVILTPTVPMIFWYLRIKYSELGYQLPSVLGFLGTPIMMCALGVIVYQLSSLVGAILLPLMLFALIVVTQHLIPEGVTAELFATAKEWHTCWPLVLGVSIVALFISYKRGGVAKTV